jgi:hypothetical protein
MERRLERKIGTWTMYLTLSVICKTDDLKLLQKLGDWWMGRISERRLVKDWLPSEQELVKAPQTGEWDECMNEKWKTLWLSLDPDQWRNKVTDHKLYSNNYQICNTTVHMPFSSTHGSMSYEWRQFTEISWQLIEDVTVLCL